MRINSARAGLLLAGAAAVLASAPARAQDDPAALRRLIQEEREAARREREAFRRAMQASDRRIRSLEERTQRLEQKGAPGTTPIGPTARPGQPGTPTPPGAPETVQRPGPAPTFSLRGPGVDVDFNIGLVVTGAGSISSAANRITQFLMPGHHDPLGNGFTLQGAELFIEGIVDPFFDGVVRVSFKLDSQAETETELEEAFLRTRNLPFGLQAKAGQFFTEFGRINVMHPHEWAFINQIVIISRLFGGDGMRGVGVQLSWLTPLPWFSQVIVSAQNGKGGAMVSFLGEQDATDGPAVQSNRDIRTFAQLVKNIRWVNGFDVTNEISANVGASFAFGNNATGKSNHTYIAGADIYVKWVPAQSTRGFPFVSAQFEYLHRWFDASFADAGTGDQFRTVLRDQGLYFQLLYGFQPQVLGVRPDLVAGMRVDYATGNGDSRNDPLRDLRWRFSPNFSWYPTERSKVRLQYDYDWAQHLGRQNVHTVMVQLEFALGAHGAHKF